VRGTVSLIYEIRCVCGKRWFSPRFEQQVFCPRRGRAALLQDPAQ